MDESGAWFQLPLWIYWFRIARDHAQEAEEAVTPAGALDATSAALSQPGTKPSEPVPKEGTRELMSSMVAIAASAHAIDGFYGSVKHLIQPPAMGATRARTILETMKVGFKIGRFQHRWLEEIDWLFAVRDAGVHHAEALREAVALRLTEKTVVLAATEAFSFSAQTARRAVNFAEEMLGACLANPRPPTQEWAESRRKVFGHHVS